MNMSEYVVVPAVWSDSGVALEHHRADGGICLLGASAVEMTLHDILEGVLAHHRNHKERDLMLANEHDQ